MSYRVAIVGLGQIGLQADLGLDASQHVYSHARAFSQHPAFELVGGVDPGAGSRELFERSFGRPAFDGLGRALSELAPEVVAIAVPTAAHAAVLDQVLAHCRPRAILCEKPLAYALEASRHMVQACEQAGCALFVNYIRRADPAVAEIARRLADGRIASPVKGVAWYSKGLFNNGSHFLDLLQFWLGKPARFTLLQAGRRLGEDFEPDFLASFAGGDIVFLAAKEENFSHYTVELVSPGGRLRYDSGGEQIAWQPAVPSVNAPGYVVLDAGPQNIPGDLSRVQWHVADQLAKALDGGAGTICTGRQALTTIEFITSITRAL